MGPHTARAVRGAGPPAAGAEVIERSSTLRGKGYALAHGVDHLRQRPPQVLVIVDADCRLVPGCLQRLAVAVASLRRPVQAAYLMGLRDSAHATAAKRVAAFAWLLKNWSRPLGAMRLGQPCHLLGSGMAFPWELAAAAPFASGHLAEDVKLGLDLALAGSPVHFCPLAVVTSVFADNPAGAASQRTRWEHGHLALLTNYGPRLLAAAWQQRRRDLLFLGADLCIPPLSLLVLLAAALAGSALLAAWWTSWAIAVLPCAVWAALLAILARAWNQVGRQILPARQVLSAAWYALRKLPLYARFVIKRQVDWVASHRDPG